MTSTLRRGRVALLIPVLTWSDNTSDVVMSAVFNRPAVAVTVTSAGLRMHGMPVATNEGEDFTVCGSRRQAARLQGT